MASVSPSGEHSVSRWLAALKADESVAGVRLWERYVERLARLARNKLLNVNRRTFDEEDIAIEVFADFLNGLRDRSFKRLDDRNDLWQLLTMLTERKVIDQIRRENAAKRGRGRVMGESVFANMEGQSTGPGINEIMGREPTPEFAAEVAETLGRLMGLLDDDLLRSLARDHLTGYTQQEMAERNGVSIPTVQRKLQLIRVMWQREFPT